MAETISALRRIRLKRSDLLCSHSAFQPRSAKTLGTRPCPRSPRTPSTTLTRSASTTGSQWPKLDAPEHAARPRGRHRGPEHSGDVRWLVGVQDLYGERLPRWTLPAVARLLAVVAQLHRVGRVAHGTLRASRCILLRHKT